MDKYISALRGGARIRITGANTAQVLNRCVESGVDFGKAVASDEFTVDISVKRKDAGKVYIIAERSMCTAQLLRENGIPVQGRRIKKRYVLMIAPVLLIVFMAWSSMHVWDIQVVGNETISDGEILRALSKAGVTTGSYWPSFVSDNIRSRVMVQIPEIRWITVNITGSRATVLVRERVQSPELFKENAGVNIEAEKAGIITDICIYRGQSRIKHGQTVAQGDVLVSGAVDSTFADTRTLHAKADIWARTWYEIVSAAPLSEHRKLSEGSEEKGLSLVFGDKRINFYNNSGKVGENYDKIYSERRLGVEGIFSLPFKLVRTAITEYELVEVQLDANDVADRLKAELLDELSGRIGLDGEIISTAFTHIEKDGIIYVTLRAECHENIAAEREMTQAEFLEIEHLNSEREEESKDDGTDNDG